MRLRVPDREPTESIDGPRGRAACSAAWSNVMPGIERFDFRTFAALTKMAACPATPPGAP